MVDVMHHHYIEELDSMSDDSRVWVYQANRILTAEEVAFIISKASVFTASWASHGSKLTARCNVLYNLFIVFVVDESLHEASGCSIDKSVNFIKELQQELGVDFFNPTLLAIQSEAHQPELVPLALVKDKLATLSLGNKTLLFNNLVSDLGAFKTSWLVPAESSWVARFLS